MIVKMRTHLHVMVKHLECWHIYKGGEKGEEKDAKPGLGCYPKGTAMPCPVHRNPWGGDRLEEAKREVLGWHRHPVQWHRNP